MGDNIDDKKKLDAFEEGKIVDNLESEEILKRARRDEKLKKIVSKSKPSKKPSQEENSKEIKKEEAQKPNEIKKEPEPKTPNENPQNKDSKKGLIILGVGILVIIIGAIILMSVWNTSEPGDINQTTEDNVTQPTFPNETEIPPLLPPDEGPIVGENVSMSILELTCTNKSVDAKVSIDSGNVDGVEFTLLVDGLVEVSNVNQSMQEGETMDFKIEFVEELEDASLVERVSIAGIINSQTTQTKSTRYC